MTTAIFITSKRFEIIAYSRAIWAPPGGFIVRASDAERLTSYEAIGADPHAVLASSLARSSIRGPFEPLFRRSGSSSFPTRTQPPRRCAEG